MVYQLSESKKLYPTKYQSGLIKSAMTESVSVVKCLVSDAVSGCSISKITTTDVRAGPPSAC